MGFKPDEVAQMQARLEAGGKRRAESGETEWPAPPQKSAGRLLEAVIQQQIADYLRSLRAFFVWHRTGQPTTCAVGTPDFVGWTKGRPFALEVKRPGCKETREQAGQLLHASLEGASVAIVHSVEEARAVIEALSPPQSRGGAEQE